MNSILMIIVAVVIILLVFIMFSLDDQDGGIEEGFSSSPEAEPPAGRSLEPVPASSSPAISPPPPAESRVSNPSAPSPGRAPGERLGDPSPQPRREAPKRPPEGASSAVPDFATIPSEKGSEQDLTFRTTLEDQYSPVSGITVYQPVVAVVQIRFPEALMSETTTVARVLERAELVLAPGKAPFPFQVALLSNLSQAWFFGIDEERDDAVFEAVVSAFNAVTRFKKALETDTVLFEAKARISIGISIGEVAKVARGPFGPVTYAGKAVYMAETLSEAAGDFQVYLDDQMHRLAQPWFDFREWKPMKLRPPLSPVAFFEVVGWNKKDEVFAYATHKEWAARRAVAVAFRYLEFDDVAPLLALLTDQDERVALETLATLAEIKDERALGVLKMILPEAKNSVVRSAIIKALGAIGKEEVIPVLLASTKDVHWQVRFNAARALFEISGPEALRHIEHLVNDEDGAVRACIHEIMFTCDPKERHLTALRELLGDLSNRARKAAVEALVQINTRESLLVVARTFFDQDQDLQRYILRLLRDARSSDTYDCFLHLFRYSDAGARTEIVAALRKSQTAG